MAIITDPVSGMKYGWASGDDGYGADMNANLQYLMFTNNVAVENRTQTAPPGSPSIGQKWIPASVATGLWVGQENNLAIWWQGPSDAVPIWYFVTMNSARAGVQALDKGADQLIMWNGTAWVLTYDYSP